MTTAEVLREARALYAANPSHAPANEYPCDGECPVTALSKATQTPGGYRVSVYAELRLKAAMGAARTVPDWNAEHTTEEVLAAFDKAIAAEEAKA